MHCLRQCVRTDLRSAFSEQAALASYHLSMKTVSRSEGRSATAAAAYRSGAKLVCEREGKTHDYTRKSGVVSTRILTPEGAEWAQDRSALWNAAEAAERRKDGVTAREWEIALPAELDAQARRVLAEGFAAELVKRYGVAADVAIHEPHREGDERNHHAHILTTTRRVGPEKLEEKTRILDAAKTGGSEVAAMRTLWAEMQNRALEMAGVEARVDHRTLKAQQREREAAAQEARKEGAEALGEAFLKAAGGYDHPAEPRMGVKLTALERKARREAQERGEAYQPVSEQAAQVIDLRTQREERQQEAARAAEEADRWFESQQGASAQEPPPDDGDWITSDAATRGPEESEERVFGGPDVIAFDPAEFPQGEEMEAAQEAPQRPRARGRGPSWSDYAEARKAYREALDAQRKTEEERRAQERASLRSAQQAQRDEIRAQDWSGRTDVLTALRSLTAAQQAGELAELWERHSTERRKERAARGAWPDFATWRAEMTGAPAPSILAPADLAPMPSPRGEDIRAYVGEADGRHVHYRRKDDPEAEVAFTDQGRTIAIHEGSDGRSKSDEERKADVLAALQLAQKKWGAVEVLSKDEAVRTLCVRLALDHGIRLANDDLSQRVEAGREARSQLMEVYSLEVAASSSKDEARKADLRQHAAKARGRAEELDAVFDPVAVAERRSREEAAQREAEAFKAQKQFEAEAAAREAAERLEAERKAKERVEAEEEVKRKQAQAREALRVRVLEEALAGQPQAKLAEAHAATETVRSDALADMAAYQAKEKFGLLKMLVSRSYNADLNAMRERYEEKRLKFEALEATEQALAAQTPKLIEERKEILRRQGYARTDAALRACVSEEALDALMEGRPFAGLVVDIARAEARFTERERERAVKPHIAHEKYNAVETAKVMREMGDAYRDGQAEFAGGYYENEGPNFDKYERAYKAHSKDMAAPAQAADRALENAYSNMKMPYETANALKLIANRKEGEDTEKDLANQLNALEIAQRILGGNVSRDQAEKDVQALHKTLQETYRAATREIAAIAERGRAVNVVEYAARIEREQREPQRDSGMER